MTVLRLGTRASKLALAQSAAVADLLREAHPAVILELVEVSTAGDRDQSTPLAEGAGAGWFTSALQDALTAGTIDIAVHSYKDLPTRRPEGLVIAAIPLREDPRDVLVSRTKASLLDLPAGAVVGTGSPRREAQLRAMHPGLDIRPIRGNVDTRLAKVANGDYDATVLAFAGLRRLGFENRITEIFGVYDMLPAPAQGALAVECRADDAATRALLAAIDDPALRPLISAERGFLATLEQGCSFPAGAYAESFGTTVKLHGLLAPGGTLVRAKITGPAGTAAGLGRALAQELMGKAGLTLPGQGDST